MTSDDVLGRIMKHEMKIQEANNIKNLYKGVSTSKKQDIALKANKSKKKKVLIESPSEKEEEEEEEKEEEEEEKENMIKIKWLYSSRNSTSSSRREDLIREKGNISQGQRWCATITVRMCTSLPNAHMRGRKKIITRERSSTNATRKIRNTLRRSIMVKLMLTKNETQVMRVLS
jgi:hypothetical protein